MTLRLVLTNGDSADLTNDDGRTLVQRLWRLSAGRSTHEGLSLSTAITEAFVDDFTVDVQERDVPALRQVLFRLGATMQLTPSLSALSSLLDRDVSSDDRLTGS